MDTQPVSYYNEISLMMFGFGDSHKPNPETVRLVESITLNQLRLIVQEASKYQEGKTLNGEQLVFLMRKNKYKMRRFIKYLHNKELKKKAQSDIPDVAAPVNNKLIQFIEMIDETGELTDLTEYDEVKYERMVRADRISLYLDEENYMKFFQARCVSFRSKNVSQIANFERLKQWIDPKKEINFSNTAMEVLGYYAYETVAQLTDYALLVRLDHNRKIDPLSNLQGTYFSASMFNGDFRFTGEKDNRKNDPLSHLQGAPFTGYNGDQNRSGERLDYSRVHSGQPPISVNEIREVMRRIYMPQAGKLNFGKKLPETQLILAI